ncbi:transposase [Nostoc muscorum FACHB-395]|nr:transposase [Desmonostoc muscorum FACHB-395]
MGSTCRACPVRSKCTQSKTQPRELSLQSQARQIALQSRRQQQQTPELKKNYNQRIGIEATHSQGIQRSALRRSRYIGLVKTHLQHILIATALNLVRLDARLCGIPFAKTRSSRFKQLQNTLYQYKDMFEISSSYCPVRPCPLNPES